jgi:hypothetical protein
MMKEEECAACREKMVEVEDSYEPEYCCGGGYYDACGCGGSPTNPVFCEECETRIFGVI